MFFEPHLPDEPQMQGAYRNFGNDEFVRFVAEHAGLPNWERIGSVEDNRSIYRLSRE